MHGGLKSLESEFLLCQKSVKCTNECMSYTTFILIWFKSVPPVVSSRVLCSASLLTGQTVRTGSLWTTRAPETATALSGTSMETSDSATATDWPWMTAIRPDCSAGTSNYNIF